MKAIKIICSTLVVIMVMVLLVQGVQFNYLLGQYQVDDILNHIRLDVDEVQDEDYGGVQPSYTIEHDKPMAQDDSIVNILLIGTNENLSDSMMIATIDMKHKSLKLTSLLRDTYVEIPGTDSKGRAYGWRKLNSAYAFGDASFLIETIAHNYNIKLDKYMVVDFSLFRSIIDTIGGVEIELSAAEAAYIRGRRLDEAGPNRKNAKEGLNLLDGWMALEFARCRMVGGFTYTDADGKEVTVNNDYARTARQRYVIQQLFKQLKDEDLGTLLSIAEQCLKYTRTNISLPELTTYLQNVLSTGATDIKQLQIPAAGTFETDRITTASVLWLSQENWIKNVEKLHHFIFES